jgi:hypothetical protein
VEFPLTVPQGYFLEKRGAGNLHTAFDVAGAGNTVRDAGVRTPDPTIHFDAGKCFFPKDFGIQGYPVGLSCHVG